MGRKPLPEDSKKVVLTVTITKKQMKFMDELAEEHYNRNKSAVIRKMLDQAIEKAGWNE